MGGSCSSPMSGDAGRDSPNPPLSDAAADARSGNADGQLQGAGGSGGGGAGGSTGCPTGNETCACYGNNTCNAGLTCASHLCVNLGTGGTGGTGGGSSGAGGGTGGASSGAGGAGGTGGASSGAGGAGTGGQSQTTGGSGGGGAGGSTGCPTANETCACYGNDTCNAGLTCASHLCVSLGTGGTTTGGTGASGGVVGSGGIGGTGGIGTGGSSASGGSTATSPDAGTAQNCGDFVTGNATCDACIASSCCSQALACVNNAACNTCTETETPPLSCSSNAMYVAFTSCYTNACSSACGLPSPDAGTPQNCSAPITTGSATCDTCLASSCCSQATSCFNNDACNTCLSEEGSTSSCLSNTPYVAFSSCWNNSCLSTCGLWCAPGQSICNGACVNKQTDPNNCGTCGNSCGRSNLCSAGQCACDSVACAADPDACGCSGPGVGSYCMGGDDCR